MEFVCALTYVTDVVIFDPPAPPIKSTTLLSESNTMDGHIDDNGRLPGLMKFDGDIGKSLTEPGREKSSISSFSKIPVCLERSLAPNLKQLKNKFT